MKPFTAIACIIFVLVALAHLLRLITGVEVVIAGMLLPLWVSAIAPVFSSGLAWMLWREGRS